MLCMICKQNEAKVHLTQIVGDKMQKVDLCEECAKTKGVNDPAGFSLVKISGADASDGGPLPAFSLNGFEWRIYHRAANAVAAK